MPIRDYFKGGPVLRNPRIIESLAMASHERMAEVKADPRIVSVIEAKPPERFYVRANHANTAVGLQRYVEAREHANDNTQVKAPANDRGRRKERVMERER
jgi:hypothetical protein